jgi:hypothetical protein
MTKKRCQKADNQKADPSKSRYFADILPIKQKADIVKSRYSKSRYFAPLDSLKPKADVQKADMQ